MFSDHVHQVKLHKTGSSATRLIVAGYSISNGINMKNIILYANIKNEIYSYKEKVTWKIARLIIDF